MVKQRERYRSFVPKECLERKERGECAVCGKVKTKYHSSWGCSKECREKFWKEYYKTNDWNTLRAHILERDGNKCVRCGKIPKEKHTLHRDIEQDTFFQETIEKCHAYFDRATGLWTYETVDKSALVADHIVPIALGGSEWEESNIQTLCKACNARKTRADIGLIAIERRIERSGEKPSKQLLLHSALDNRA